MAQIFGKKIIRWIVYLIAALFVIGLINNLTRSPEEKARIDAENAQYRERKAAERAQAEEERIKNMPRIAAPRLVAEFEANEVAANNKYKGKTIIIKGKIISISTTITGAPQVSLGGINVIQGVHAELERDQKDLAATLQKGASVSIMCTISGYTLGSVVGNDCRILK